MIDYISNQSPIINLTNIRRITCRNIVNNFYGCDCNFLGFWEKYRVNIGIFLANIGANIGTQLANRGANIGYRC